MRETTENVGAGRLSGDLRKRPCMVNRCDNFWYTLAAACTYISAGDIASAGLRLYAPELLSVWLEFLLILLFSLTLGLPLDLYLIRRLFHMKYPAETTVKEALHEHLPRHIEVGKTWKGIVSAFVLALVILCNDFYLLMEGSVSSRTLHILTFAGPLFCAVIAVALSWAIWRLRTSEVDPCKKERQG